MRVRVLARLKNAEEGEGRARRVRAARSRERGQRNRRVGPSHSSRGRGGRGRGSRWGCGGMRQRKHRRLPLGLQCRVVRVRAQQLPVHAVARALETPRTQALHVPTGQQGVAQNGKDGCRDETRVNGVNNALETQVTAVWAGKRSGRTSACCSDEWRSARAARANRADQSSMIDWPGTDK